MTVLPREIPAYIKLGLKLIPLSRPDDQSIEERYRGKRPVYGFSDWPNLATSDIGQLTEWAGKFPSCNWAFATGVPSNIVVIDVDGPEGHAAVAALAAEGFVLPPTLTVTTGRGLHLYYRLPPGVDVRNNNNGKLGNHIDIRGSGGYCVCPPSTHVSGRRYSFVDTTVAIAILPDWVVERLRRPEPPPPGASTSNGEAVKVGKGGRTILLVSLAGTMRKRGMSLEAVMAALLAENVARFDEPLPEAKVRNIAADIFARYPAGAPNGAEAEPDPAGNRPATDPMLSPLPKVRLPGDNWQLSETATDLAQHLGSTSIFIRNGEVVTLEGHELRPVSTQSFCTLVERYVVCYRKRKAGDNTYAVGVSMTDNESGRITASPQFIKQMRPVRRLNLCRQPVLRDDGRIDLAPDGYDPESQTLTAPTASYVDDMSLADGKAVIDDVFSEFIFADKGRSKAVAVAALIGLYAAQLLPESSYRPFFVITKNAPGAGASTLAKCAVVPVFDAFPTTTAPENDEAEMKKTLITAVREAQQVLIFDNQKGRLSSSALEGFQSAFEYGGRLLGQNRSFTGPNVSTVFITSNGATLSSDMCRRSLFIELHLEAERPEDREFKRSLNVKTLQSLRPQLLAACWALVRNWDLQGRPQPTKLNSSFPEWSQIIGGIVEAAGYGCALDTAAVAIGADEDTDSMRTLVAAMRPGRPHTFGDIVNLCRTCECFMTFVGEAEMKPGVRQAFGRLLGSWDKRLIGDRRFGAEGKYHARRFHVEVFAAAQSWDEEEAG